MQRIIALFALVLWSVGLNDPALAQRIAAPRPAAPPAAASPGIHFGPILRNMRPPAQQQPQQPTQTTGFAQPIKMMDGGRGMMWNGTFYLRGNDGHWRKAGPGLYLARKRFNIKVAAGGSITNSLLRRVTMPIMAEQQIIRTGGMRLISVHGSGFPSLLKLHPLFPVLYQVLPQNTALQAYSKSGPIVTNGEFQSTGVWGNGGAFGGVSMTAEFQWTTDPSRVTQAVFQISTKAFPGGPVTNTNWDTPFDGLRGTVAVPGPVSGTNRFEVDLRKFADFTNPQHPKLFVARVVPLDGAGNIAGAPTAPVYLVTPYVPPLNLPPGQTQPKTYPPHFDAASWTPAQNPANADDFTGPPAQPSDIVTTITVDAITVANAFPGYVQLTVDGNSLRGQAGIVPANTHIHLDWSPPDEGTSGWDAFADFVSQLGDCITGAINWVASTYNTFEGMAIKSVSDIIQSVGLPPAIANAVSNIVVGSVMVSCGIPPSLPDMDQLDQEGLDYITDVALDEMNASGVVDAAQTVISTDKIRAGIGKTVAMVKNVQAGGGDPNNWFTPDPAILYHPPVFVVRASYNPSSSDPQTSDRADLTVEVRCELSNDSTSYQIAEQNGAKPDLPMWTGRAQIPPLHANESYVVPVVLDFSFNHPDLTGKQVDKDDWSNSYPECQSGRFFISGNGSMHPINQPWSN